MEPFIPRRIAFKAWNTETRLLMRLNSIDCKKGELFKKDHILLQFTGLYDKQEDEIFEMDIMLIGAEKFLVMWDGHRNGWALARLADTTSTQPLVKETVARATRLWSYYEAGTAG